MVDEESRENRELLDSLERMPKAVASRVGRDQSANKDLSDPLDSLELREPQEIEVNCPVNSNRTIIGAPGAKGRPGPDGHPGPDGKPGQPGQKGQNGGQGERGVCPKYCATDGGVFFENGVRR